MSEVAQTPNRGSKSKIDSHDGQLAVKGIEKILQKLDPTKKLQTKKRHWLRYYRQRTVDLPTLPHRSKGKTN